MALKFDRRCEAICDSGLHLEGKMSEAESMGVQQMSGQGTDLFETSSVLQDSAAGLMLSCDYAELSLAMMGDEKQESGETGEELEEERAGWGIER